MTTEYIPLTECKPRHIYRIRSRNLDVGVFDGNIGFIGIRMKFRDRYLFTEDHHDTGAPFGTVMPIEDLGELPADIEAIEYTPTVDSSTGREIAFDEPVDNGGKGWYYLDTGEPKPEEGMPTSSTYKPLFDYLDTIKCEED